MKLATWLAAATLALSSTVASADDYRQGVDETPSGAAMAFDLVLVRPASFIGTILGCGLFVLDLPLSVIQGEPPSGPAKRFIMEPARYTFTRPLGQMDW
jgi:hypothetical protein